jgi:hypothetical protein
VFRRFRIISDEKPVSRRRWVSATPLTWLLQIGMNRARLGTVLSLWVLEKKGGVENPFCSIRSLW